MDDLQNDFWNRGSFQEKKQSSNFFSQFMRDVFFGGFTPFRVSHRGYVQEILILMQNCKGLFSCNEQRGLIQDYLLQEAAHRICIVWTFSDFFQTIFFGQIR